MCMLVDCRQLPASGFAPESLTAWSFWVFKPWPGIKLWRESFGRAGARVRSAARTSLFQALWWLESRGGSVRDLHLHLHAAGLGYCCRHCPPRSPCVSPFIRPRYQSLPKGRMPVVHLARALGEQCGPGGRCVCWNWGDFGCSGSWPHRQPALRTIGR